jgi:hypothetical protein
MKKGTGPELPLEAPKPTAVPETLEEKPSLKVVEPQMTVKELLEKAVANGFKQSDVVTAARVYHNQTNVYRLTPEQVADLDRRMTARVEKQKGEKATPRAARRA